MEEALDEARQDRRDHAEGEHVERDGEEDEGCGCTTSFEWSGSERCAVDWCDELGLGEEGVWGLVRRLV